MEEIVLKAELRKEVGRGKTKHLKDAGSTPCVVYSAGKESLPIKLSTHELVQLVHQHRIENTILNVKIKDDKKDKRPCLIKEIQYHPVTGNILHIDFNEISLTKAIKVNVPILAKGEAVGVKNEGGSLEHILWEIEVECLPTDIPKNIEVDITNLKLKDSIHVKDLILPQGIKPLTDLGAVVLTVAEPMKEEVAPEAVEGEEAKEPEVIKEKKEVPAEGEAKEEGKKESK